MGAELQCRQWVLNTIEDGEDGFPISCEIENDEGQ